jgi:hypothetical protein
VFLVVFSFLFFSRILMCSHSTVTPLLVFVYRVCSLSEYSLACSSKAFNAFGFIFNYLLTYLQFAVILELTFPA